MSRSLKIYLGLLIILFVGIVLVEMSTPPPVNWQKSFNEKDKIPYGTFIFYNELEKLFPESQLYDITVTPYEYFDSMYEWEDSTYYASGNYIAVSEYTDIDNVSAQELLDFASIINENDWQTYQSFMEITKDVIACLDEARRQNAIVFRTDR